MHKYFIPCDHVRLIDSPVSHPGSHHDQQIRFVDCTIGVGFPVISHHSEIQRMICRHNADAHHGRYHRNAVLFREPAQILLRPAQKHAAARTDNGTLCFLQFFDHLFDLHSISLDGGLVSAHGNRIGIFEFTDCGILNIDWNINQHRATSAGICNMESFLEYSGDIIHIFNQVTVFYERLYRSRNICLLEYIAAQKLAVHLSGDADQGNAVRKCRGNACDHIGGART